MVVKNMFIILFLMLVSDSANAQVEKEASYFLNYNIKNEVLKKEIDNFLEENKNGYENDDKVVWLTINFDLKSFNTIYRIGYKTNFDFFSIKEKNRFDHPDIVTKYKETCCAFRKKIAQVIKKSYI